MPTARAVLTPDALSMLQAIAEAGSFAAAARAIGLVPSTLPYRVRQMEDALDLLLFDRSSRQARALQWWLKQLESPATRLALLAQQAGV